MANETYETDLFDRALKFASDAHHGTGRRGKGFPYIIHCMEAAEIVATITNDQEILAAALLHDVIEDTDITAEDIQREFGARVTELVVGESEPDNVFESESAERSSWEDRKRFVIARLAKQPRDNKIVALGDKLSNMRAIARDFNREGDKIWDLFHAPDPHMHEWHYRGLVESLRELEDTEAFQEFAGLVDDVFSRAYKSDKKEEKVKTDSSEI